MNAKNKILEAKELSVFYGNNQAVKKVSFYMEKNLVTAIIGPSGCGKSTILRTLNRMNDFVPNVNIEGKIEFYGRNIFKSDPMELRTRIGMVFQRPNPFPKSILENITWGPKIHGYNKNYEELVETSLKKAALWDEVKNR
ncbi:MAG: ATP-binding cassette domain-containing protein, partial [Halobacteriovoraceae bacterium]|nr:ATP-binding cassette domain-containing protein [Halobacteriovoraceae bacterium]